MCRIERLVLGSIPAWAGSESIGDTGPALSVAILAPSSSPFGSFVVGGMDAGGEEDGC